MAARTPFEKSYTMASNTMPSIANNEMNRGRIPLHNSTEITYPVGGLAAHNFEHVTRNYNVEVITCQGNVKSMYAVIKGSKQGRINAMEYFQFANENVHELSGNWCCICYSDGHLSNECNFCVACGADGHKSAQCHKVDREGFAPEELEVKRPDARMRTVRQRGNWRKRQGSFEEAKVPGESSKRLMYYNYTEDKGANVIVAKGFGFDVEKFHFSNYPNCGLVVLTAYNHPKNVQLVYKAYVNRILHLTGTDYSNVPLPERRQGLSIEEVKADVLSILANHTVYTHTGMEDFESLDISEDDLAKNNINHRDLTMLSDGYGSHRNEKNEAASLRDMYWFYKGVAIQHYSKELYCAREHSCEIDSQSALKLGVMLSDPNCPVINCDEIRAKVQQDMAAGILTDWSKTDGPPYVFSNTKTKYRFKSSYFKGV